jgi:hypothetical protein
LRAAQQPPASDLPSIHSIEYEDSESLWDSSTMTSRSARSSVRQWIESLNARYRGAVRARGHFPTEQAALKCLYLVTRSVDRSDAARHAGPPDASMTTATICARLFPAPAARRSTATKPTVTPPTTKPARHRYEEQHEVTDFVADGRSAGPVRIGPLPADQAAVPGHQRAGVTMRWTRNQRGVGGSERTGSLGPASRGEAWTPDGAAP